MKNVHAGYQMLIFSVFAVTKLTKLTVLGPTYKKIVYPGNVKRYDNFSAKEIAKCTRLATKTQSAVEPDCAEYYHLCGVADPIAAFLEIICCSFFSLG